MKAYLFVAALVVIQSCSKSPKPILMPSYYDYQIELHMDTVWVYDKGRLVGSYINTTWNSQLDSIIVKDNY